MNRINELVGEVQADSNGTLVRSQRIAIALAIAKAFQLGAAYGANLDMANEVKALTSGDDSAIE
jgi:hypothetical protein